MYTWKEGSTEHCGCFSIDLQIANTNFLDGLNFDYATEYVRVPGESYRPQGVYRFKTVEASVELQYTKENNYYLLRIRFVRLAEAKEFLHLFMAGKIWPQVCCGDQQAPSPTRHMRGLLREAWAILRRDVTQKLHGFSH